MLNGEVSGLVSHVDGIGRRKREVAPGAYHLPVGTDDILSAIERQKRITIGVILKSAVQPEIAGL